MARKPPEAPDPDTSLDRLTSQIEELRTSLEESAASAQELGELGLAGWRFGRLTLIIGMGTGAAFAWAVAAGMTDPPRWPTYAFSGSTILLALLGAWRLNRPDEWRKNVETLRDNVLVMAVGVIIALALLVLDRLTS